MYAYKYSLFFFGKSFITYNSFFLMSPVNRRFASFKDKTDKRRSDASADKPDDVWVRAVREALGFGQEHCGKLAGQVGDLNGTNKKNALRSAFVVCVVCNEGFTKKKKNRSTLSSARVV